MVFKMLLLSFSVLLIVRVTLGKIDCEIGPFENCESTNEIPLEVSGFYDLCVDLKSYFRCINEFQVQCGMERMVVFPTPDLFEDVYNTLSDICEEGNLLNLVITENLKCLNETFGRTRCHEEAEEFIEPLVKRAREEEKYELSIFCLEETLLDDCALRAISENCGKLVEQATLEIFRRSKAIEYACSVSGAKSVLDELDNLDLSEAKKKAMTLLLEKLVE